MPWKRTGSGRVSFRQVVLLVCAAAAAGVAACLAAGKACDLLCSSGGGTSKFFSVPAEKLLKNARALPR